MSTPLFIQNPPLLPDTDLPGDDNYLLFCYKSEKSQPDLEEAEEICYADEYQDENKPAALERKLHLADIFRKHDSNLRCEDIDNFDDYFDPETETREEFFEVIFLETGSEEQLFEISIYDQFVMVEIPFPVQESENEAFFAQGLGYIRALADAEGYFVLDAMTDQVYDARTTPNHGYQIYKALAEKMRNAPAED
ncbi:MAG: hypothetical protein ACRC3B_17925 [Bacteroidia bacterium]